MVVQGMIWRVLTFIGVAFTAGVLGTWAGERDTPVYIRSVNVLTPVVRPGADLRIRYHVYRRDNCRTTLQRVLLDHQLTRYILDDIVLWSAPGPLGDDEYTSAVPLPVKFAPGVANYRAVTKYECNPVHYFWPIVRVASDLEFKVEGPPLIVPQVVIPAQ